MLQSHTSRRIAPLLGAAALIFATTSCALLPNFSSSPVRDAETGDISERTDNTDVFQIVVGDCMITSDLPDQVSEVRTMPCSEPHEDEIYHSFTMDKGEYPGEDVIAEEADRVCTAEFENFIGISYLSSSLEFFPFTPTADGWQAGDREVLCAVYDPNDFELVGSLEAAAR